MKAAVRTPWQVTFSVWHALFMREVTQRLFANRFAWFWLFAEPVLFVVLMVAIRSFIRAADTVAGADMIVWMVLGLGAFFLFRDGMIKGMNAISANKALFGYRQVKPVDTVFIRNVIEGLIHFIVLVLLLVGVGLLNHEVLPDQALSVVFALWSLWLLALGFGLVLSVTVMLVAEVKLIVNILTLPLLIVSGAMFPLQFLPAAMQEVLLMNPIVHALELLRLAYFENYWSLVGVSYEYLYLWIGGTLTLGLILQLRFETKMKAH